MTGEVIASGRRELREPDPMPPAASLQLPEQSGERTWGGLPVTVRRAPFSAMLDLVPEFARRPLRVDPANGAAARANGRLQAVVRLPTSDDPEEVAVGAVSSGYQLVQHREVVVCVREALTSERIEPATFETTLTLTANGERMALSVLMPEEDRFDYSIAPNDAMRFRLECFNSVDGTMRLMLAMGWLRFVCSNGLVLGRSVAHVRRAHTPTLNLRYVGRAIREGLINAAKDRTRWDAWRSTRVEPEALRRWADGSLRQQWGVKAAARTFAICTTGSDVELIKPFESNLPSQRSSTPLGKVPGAPPAATNVFDVAQALSWVAGQRRDLDASAAAIRDIPTVVDMLVRRLHERRN